MRKNFYSSNNLVFYCTSRAAAKRMLVHPFAIHTQTYSLIADGCDPAALLPFALADFAEPAADILIKIFFKKLIGKIPY
jgi:hypothetical protein